MSNCVWLFDHFKQGLVFYNRFPWPWFVFETGFTFFETSEPILCYTFVNSSWAFHIVYFFANAFVLSHFILFLFFFSFSSSSSSFYYFLWVFHASISWWSFTGVCVTASLLRSSGLFLVCWSISAMQWFGWFGSVLRFQSHPAPFPSLWEPFLNIFCQKSFSHVFWEWEDINAATKIYVQFPIFSPFISPTLHICIKLNLGLKRCNE